MTDLTYVAHLEQGAGAAGYIGKISDISWIARAYHFCTASDPTTANDDELEGPSVAQYSYFMDEANLLSVDEDYIDPYEQPDDLATQILSGAYFHSVEGVFDFVSRESFLQGLASYQVENRRSTWEARRWLGMANLIWAVASRWLSAAKLDLDSMKIEHHTTYYARARALGTDHRVMFDHLDFQGVQSLGILSFYMLINGSVHR